MCVTANVGIDVSKGHLDVAFSPTGPVERFKNTESGHAQLIEALQRGSPERIVLEATGGLELPVAIALAEAGLPAVIVNPRRVRDFAKSVGQFAKTDALDACVIAQFGKSTEPEAHPIPDAEIVAFKQLLARRRQLSEMLVAESNRAKRATDQLVSRSIDTVIAVLQRELDETNKLLDKAIDQSPTWRKAKEILTSVPGIGDQTARALIAGLPELGTCSRQRIASLVGVAPFAKDSGKMTGKRVIQGGRRHLRCALYMATVVATQWNPVIKAYYERLLSAGKSKMTALIACMRKLLTILNAMMKKEQKWLQGAC